MAINIMDLPVELQVQILSYLSSWQQIAITGRVCGPWRRLVLDESLRNTRYTDHPFSGPPTSVDNERPKRSWKVHGIFTSDNYLEFTINFQTGILEECWWGTSEGPGGPNGWETGLEITTSPVMDEPVFHMPTPKPTSSDDVRLQVGFLVGIFLVPNDDIVPPVIERLFPMWQTPRGPKRYPIWIELLEFARHHQSNLSIAPEDTDSKAQVMEAMTIRSFCTTVAKAFMVRMFQSEQRHDGDNIRYPFGDTFLNKLQQHKPASIRFGVSMIRTLGRAKDWTFYTSIMSPINYNLNQNLSAYVNKQESERAERVAEVNDPIWGISKLFKEGKGH